MVIFLQKVYRYVEYRGLCHGAIVIMLLVGVVRIVQLTFYMPEAWEPSVDGHTVVVLWLWWTFIFTVLAIGIGICFHLLVGHLFINKGHDQSKPSLVMSSYERDMLIALFIASVLFYFFLFN